MEKWAKNETIYAGKVVTLRVGEVYVEGGQRARREIVEHPGGVAIVPVIERHIVLVRQFRIAAEREMLELPAGRLEPGEDPAVCAGRELEEEIGYRAARLVPSVSYFSSVGFTTERMHIFLALDPAPTRACPEWDEHVRLVRIPIDQLRARLCAHEFDDSKTIIGLWEFIAFMDRQRSGR